MNWESVDSSQISEVGYDAASSTLGIRFKAGSRSPASEYHYANVPPLVHRAMITAESVGSYFAAEIKKRPDIYPYTKIGDVLPPAPENPDSALLKIDKMTPEQIFAPGTMDPILEAIRTEVMRQASKLDISTEQNRKALGSLAFKVTKSKTFIEGQRKSLVAAEKKRLAAIDAEGRRIWDILEGIAIEVRKPLTDWEQIDKDRVSRHEATLASLLEAAKVPFGATVSDLKAIIARVEAIDPATCEEFAQLASGHKATALKELNAALKFSEEMERQKSENERLKAAAAERETQERAISAARFAREQAERDAEAERQRLMAEKQQAEDRAAAAERRALQAVEEERARAAEAKAKEDAETAKREANKKHVAKINKEIMDALLDLSFGDDLEILVKAIAAGKIPHVTITY
jgi:hypothetical protein